jgi:hypothetical protein
VKLEDVDVRVLRLKPYDKLVVTTPDRLTKQQALQLKDAIERHLPGHEVLIFSAGLQLEVAREVAA